MATLSFKVMLIKALSISTHLITSVHSLLTHATISWKYYKLNSITPKIKKGLDTSLKIIIRKYCLILSPRWSSISLSWSRMKMTSQTSSKMCSSLLFVWSLGSFTSGLKCRTNRKGDWLRGRSMQRLYSLHLLWLFFGMWEDVRY